MRYKVHEVSHLIAKSSLSVLGISETWLGSADSDALLSVNGYDLFRRDRSPQGGGGGVCLYVKEGLHASVEKQYSHPNIELLWIRIPVTKHSRSILIGCIYRPPSSTTAFWPVLESTLEDALAEEIVLLGDLNVDFLCPDQPCFQHINRFLLIPLCLQNLISSPTRFGRSHHSCLDVILTNSDRLHSGQTIDCDLSDHCLVSAILDYSISRRNNSHPESQRLTRHDLRHFNPTEFLGKL